MNLSDLLNQLGIWALDSVTAIDLIAVSSNAFCGAILVMRPDHRREWNNVGIVGLAIVGGIGGTLVRDILLVQTPSALTNPFYLVLSILAGGLALLIVRRNKPDRLENLLEFMLAFSLPWFAIVGVQKASAVHLPLIGVLFVAAAGALSGRYFLDIASGVTPIYFTNGGWYLGSTLLAAALYLILASRDLSIWWAAISAWLVTFIFRYFAMRLNWEKLVPWTKKVGTGL
jgi:uncharacterized membrane protein YeiH